MLRRCHAPNDGVTVDDELEVCANKQGRSDFKILSWDPAGRTEQNYEKTQLR
jgi:hypothetical protein